MPLKLLPIKNKIFIHDYVSLNMCDPWSYKKNCSSFIYW